MGLAAKEKPRGSYGVLLRLYPQSFQRHYAVAMQQTFDDMLSGEKTKLGRLRVWARTLGNLPLSAAKEHVTNGKDILMTRNMKLMASAIVVVVLAVGLGSFWAGNLHARSTMAVEQVSVAQLANAMQQDSFYSTYGSTAVLFSGKVSTTINKNGASLVTFATGRPYNVVCQFAQTTSFAVGQTVSVAAPAGSAERQPHGVLLHSCIKNPRQ
jgi:hypothetical protein